MTNSSTNEYLQDRHVHNRLQIIARADLHAQWQRHTKPLDEKLYSATEVSRTAAKYTYKQRRLNSFLAFDLENVITLQLYSDNMLIKIMMRCFQYGHFFRNWRTQHVESILLSSYTHPYTHLPV